MSTVSTAGLGLGANRSTCRQWLGSYGCFLTDAGVSTDSPDLPEEVGLAPRCGPHPVPSVWDEVRGILGRVLPSGNSHPIDPAWRNVICSLQENDWPVADFFEPITLDWDPDILDARAAARRYSEQTDADY
jgi:hypothetical protein